MNLVTIRASATPSAFTCAESIRTPDFTIQHDNDANSTGTGAHVLCAQVVTRDITSTTAELPVRATATAYEVDPDELGRLAYYGILAWRELRTLMPGALTEVALSGTLRSGVRLSGHLDVVATIGKLARIVDWKSGMLDKSYYHQLMAYAWLVFMDDLNVDTVEASIVWLRESQIESYTFTRAQAIEWEDRLHAEVIDAPAGSFTTGKHCAYCPRSHNCPALRALARRDIELFAGPEMAHVVDVSLADMPPAGVVALHRRSKVVASMCESLHQAVRREVAVRGGSIDAGDGTELRFTEDSKRVVEPLTAWPVLQKRLTDEEMAPAITLSIGALEDAVAAKVGRGFKGAVKKELGEALEAAGAVSKKVVKKLMEMRKK